MEARITTRSATIAEWPVPPKRRLAFPRLILRMIGNPIAGWSPRTCVGGTFAMLEGKTILATLLAHARFALPQGEAPTPFVRITLRPKEGLKLDVTMLD
jgi:cytochrome P450